ncbi:MAG: cytochrome C oxidase subunit II [bacterium]
MASIAGWVTLGATLIVVLVALFVAANARETIPGGPAAIYGVRKYYAGALLLGLLVALGASLPHTPYSALLETEPSMRVDVIGRMWSWEIHQAGDASGGPSPLVLPVGKIVEFAVTSADVNHGFGLYDDGGHLLAQAQAMPGYVNHLRHVFDLPGRYHVVCLEYCGLVHHAMLTELAVQ